MALIIFAIAGTMQAQHQWNSSTPPAAAHGATITIATGASGTLIVPENATVTINSSCVVDNGNWQITLNISQNARVVWRADYISRREPIDVVGSGIFEVAAGHIINTVSGFGQPNSAITTSSNSTIVVSGGEVSSWAHWSRAVIRSFHSAGIVTVSGGMVIARGNSRQNGQAIEVVGTLNVTGGLVIADLPQVVGGFGNGVVSRTPTGVVTGTIIGYTLGRFTYRRLNNRLSVFACFRSQCIVGN